MNKRLLSIILSFLMVFSVTTAFAVDSELIQEKGNVYKLDGSLFATSNEMNISSEKSNQVNIEESQFLYGFNGKLYKMKDAQNAFKEADKDMDVFETIIVEKETATIITPPGDVVSPSTPVSAISINEADRELEVGTTLQLTTKFTPTNATNKNVTWKSSNEDIATVNINGLVSAISKGEATITVTTFDGAKKDSVVITVVEKEENTPEVAKAAFLERLKTAISSDVATVEITGESIGVTFAHNATVDGIKEAADGLVTELLAEDVTGTLTIDNEKFNLGDADVATDVARAILEGTAEKFLNNGSADVGYKATVTVDGVKFILNGQLNFQMAQ